jgi:chemotaxis protein methyltransferase CheR
MASSPLCASTPAPSWNDVRLTTRDFDLLRSFIESEVGIQIPPAKRVMLEGRLRRRLKALGYTKFRDYTSHVFGPRRDDGEIVHLIDAVTTNKTDFFREPHHFDFLVNTALPQLTAGGEAGVVRPIVVWSAASSTGEEPYTLAMMLNEFAEAQPITWQVVATDISTAVLDRARRAIYSTATAAPVPPALKYKYLMRSRDRSKALVRIVPGLRQKVTFQRLNLLAPRYDVPKPVDIVFCRNVFIYFDRSTQEKILHRFADLLHRGGFVFLGHSETINGSSVPLVQVAPTVYQKAI